jgi:hypothetical protein
VAAALPENSWTIYSFFHCLQSGGSWTHQDLIRNCFEKDVHCDAMTVGLINITWEESGPGWRILLPLADTKDSRRLPRCCTYVRHIGRCVAGCWSPTCGIGRCVARCWWPQLCPPLMEWCRCFESSAKHHGLMRMWSFRVGASSSCYSCHRCIATLSFLLYGPGAKSAHAHFVWFHMITEESVTENRKAVVDCAGVAY